MEREKLAKKFLEALDALEDNDERMECAQKVFNDVIDRYWLSHFIVRADNGVNHCGLCGNNGVIHSTCFTPNGNKIDRKFFCICPNGQNLKKLKRDPNLCYCPTEKDFPKNLDS